MTDQNAVERQRWGGPSPSKSAPPPRNARHRAADLLISAFRSVGQGGAFSPADEINVAAAVDALIDAASEPEPEHAGGPHAPQVASTVVSIGRLLDVARSLNDGGSAALNPPYLDGQLALICAVAGLDRMRAQVSVEPTAEALRKSGQIDQATTGRRLFELAGTLVARIGRMDEVTRGMVELICEALCLSTDDYRVQVEDAIREGLPWHGYLRPVVRMSFGAPEQPDPVLPPIRKLISLARETQDDGECNGFPEGQAVLICKILGLPTAHIPRIVGLITEAEESARCQWCRRIIRQRDAGVPWTDAGADSYICPVSSFGHLPDDNAI